MSKEVEVLIVGEELYPAYRVADANDVELNPNLPQVSVTQDTLDRWLRVQREFGDMCREIRDLLDPPCPECGHPTSRHQEFSSGWDYLGMPLQDRRRDLSLPARQAGRPMNLLPHKEA